MRFLVIPQVQLQKQRKDHFPELMIRASIYGLRTVTKALSTLHRGVAYFETHAWN
jgi:hypothetical protein